MHIHRMSSQICASERHQDSAPDLMQANLALQLLEVGTAAAALFTHAALYEHEQ